MKRYEKYKDSKVTWLGQVPEHWQDVRLAGCFTEVKETNKDTEFDRAFQFKYGNIVYKKDTPIDAKAIATFKKHAKVNENDIVVNGLNLNYDFLTQRVAIVHQRGIITSAYITMTPRDIIVPKFACYLLKVIDEKKLLNGMGTGIRLTLSFGELKKQYIPYTSTAEQEQIVRYLDWKVAMADKFVREKRREITLLKELRQAEINGAVTRGLDPTAPTKPSGINWIGEIPAHWDFVTLRTLLKPFSEKNHPTKKLLSVTRELGVIIRDCDSKEENHNFIPDDLSGYKLLKKNQFVINKMKAWQGSYGISLHEGIVSPAYFIFDLITNISPVFFGAAIRSKVYVPFFAQYSDGIRTGQWDLSQKKLKQIPFYLPPIDEQQQIVAHIQTVEERINKAIEDIEKQISLVAEYKTSLISDVTTGKVDVRGIEIPDSEKEEPTVIEDDNEDNNE